MLEPGFDPEISFECSIHQTSELVMSIIDKRIKGSVNIGESCMVSRYSITNAVLTPILRISAYRLTFSRKQCVIHLPNYSNVFIDRMLKSPCHPIRLKHFVFFRILIVCIFRLYLSLNNENVKLK